MSHFMSVLEAFKNKVFRRRVAPRKARESGD
jgi:hypothetical protein